VKGVTTEVISQVRARADIHEIVSETVVLKRAGRSFKGLCPFHSEKTPSFTVTPERGIFYCFGCNERGDVFAFVQKTKGLGFIDAVRELALRYGIPLVETAEDKREYDRRTLLLLLYQQANEYFRRLLKDPAQGLVAREYLRKRGVTEEIIEQFQIGYAASGWDGLLNYLVAANKVSPQTLAEAGLVRNKAETNKFYDLFRHRLMIPIHDEQGRVIAFGGRALAADEQVKYINSPESPIYTKGEHLYALHQAKDSIKKQDSVIVVEGYFDAITAHQYGFTNTVATLGTALTERQAKLLVRFTESRRVFLCFDADVAGQRAVDSGTQTMNQVAEGVGIELRVIAVPGGKDPDECLRGEGEHAGKAAFEAAYTGAPLFVDYQLEKAVSRVDLKTHTGRIEGARLVVPILAQMKNAVARGEYVRQWALRLNVKEEELLSDVGVWRRQNRAGASAPVDPRLLKKAAQKNAPRAGHIEAERQLLALFLMSKDDHEAAREALVDDRLIEPVHQQIKEAVEGIGRFTTTEDFQLQLMDRLGPDPQAAAALIDIILKVDELQRQNLPREVILKDNRARILRELLNQGKNRLRGLLPTASSDQEQSDLQSKIMTLQLLETRALREAQTDDQLADIRRQIDSLLPETIK
jgi:DNA primase